MAPGTRKRRGGRTQVPGRGRRQPLAGRGGERAFARSQVAGAPGAAQGTPIVTFLSDFGSGSGYPAQMKGEVLRVLPGACLVDLTHDVARFDVLAAALVLEACLPHFPQSAVHVAVVDPGVGTERRPICVVDAEGRSMVGPDNGLFTPFLGAGARAYLIARTDWTREPTSFTFHGRDIFAPAAAWLADGGEPAELGPAVVDPVRIDWPVASRGHGQVEGACLVSDSFGNVLTSVRARDLEGAPVEEVCVDRRAARFVRTYGEGAPGELLALIGSSGRMEIAVREGNAARELGTQRGTLVVVKFRAPDLVPERAPATL